jgi:hypothetical protein
MSVEELVVMYWFAWQALKKRFVGVLFANRELLFPATRSCKNVKTSSASPSRIIDLVDLMTLMEGAKRDFVVGRGASNGKTDSLRPIVLCITTRCDDLTLDKHVRVGTHI